MRSSCRRGPGQPHTAPRPEWHIVLYRRRTLLSIGIALVALAAAPTSALHWLVFGGAALASFYWLGALVEAKAFRGDDLAFELAEHRVPRDIHGLR